MKRRRSRARRPKWRAETKSPANWPLNPRTNRRNKRIIKMAGKKAVFGIYPNRTSAENAVDALKAVDFRNTDISVLLPGGAGTKDFAHEKSTKAPEGATTGAGTGALLGGGLRSLLRIGPLAIPGLGPFIAAGPI